MPLSLRIASIVCSFLHICLIRSSGLAETHTFSPSGPSDQNAPKPMLTQGCCKSLESSQNQRWDHNWSDPVSLLGGKNINWKHLPSLFSSKYLLQRLWSLGIHLDLDIMSLVCALKSHYVLSINEEQSGAFSVQPLSAEGPQDLHSLLEIQMSETVRQQQFQAFNPCHSITVPQGFRELGIALMQPSWRLLPGLLLSSFSWT